MVTRKNRKNKNLILVWSKSGESECVQCDQWPTKHLPSSQHTDRHYAGQNQTHHMAMSERLLDKRELN